MKYDQSSGRYFDAIDLLRGFAAVSVLVYHVIEHFQWAEFPSSGPLSWFRAGWMGVDLFFVISGFVIGLSAFSGIDLHGPKAFRSIFVRRRLARIVPLHYFTILIFLIFVAPEVLLGHVVQNVFSHLLFIHNLNMNWHGSINGSNWSLAVEMQFYLLILALAPWLRAGRWWVIAGLFVSISWIWRYVVGVYLSASWNMDAFTAFVGTTQLPGTLDEFAGGLLVARLLRSKWGRELLALGSWGRLSLVVLCALWITLSMTIFWRFATYWDHPWMVVMWKTLLAFAYALLLLLAVTINLTGFIKLLLSPVCYLGTISFGIYLWHLPVLLSLEKLGGITPAEGLSLVFCFSFLLAVITWHFFEKPIIDRWRYSHR